MGQRALRRSLACLSASYVELFPHHGRKNLHRAFRTAPPTPDSGDATPETQSAATPSAPETATHPVPGVCVRDVPDHRTVSHRPNIGSGRYKCTDASGNLALNPRGQPVEYAYSRVTGHFEIAHSATDKTIEVKVNTLCEFYDWRKVDSERNLVRDAGGAPVSVPFDAGETFSVRGGTANFVESSRPPNPAILAILKNQATATIGRRQYSLMPTTCPTPAACECKVAIKFDLNYVVSGPSHNTVRVFPMGIREDAGNIAEKSVVINPDPLTAETTPYLEVVGNSVKGHEFGHILGWPDEYFEKGGAVNKKYIKQDLLIDVAMQEEADDWKRASSDNLMGYGAWNSTVLVQPYYMNHVKDWFSEKTGAEWIIVEQ